MSKSVDSNLNDNSSDGDGLLYHWVAAGMISAAARFIPVPYVDDVVQFRCRRYVVHRTVETLGDDAVAKNDFRPLYDDGGGVLRGCIGMAAKLPLKLLLFPVRKFIAMVTSIRGVPLEIIRTILLGRTTVRLLRRPADSPLDPVVARQAFETAFHRMDFRVAGSAIRDVIRSVRGWKSSAIEKARRAESAEGVSETEFRKDDSLDDATNRIVALLGTPETQRLFEDFDRRFDEAVDVIGDRRRSSSMPGP